MKKLKPYTFWYTAFCRNLICLQGGWNWDLQEKI